MNLNYEGDGNFQDLLDRSGIPRTIYDIKAYILGTILAPEMVMPSHLIANILDQGTEDEIEFEDREEGEFFISQVMALWNEILKFQGGKSAPVFSPIPEEYEELDQLLYALSERANELQSFLFGLAEG